MNTMYVPTIKETRFGRIAFSCESWHLSALTQDTKSNPTNSKCRYLKSCTLEFGHSKLTVHSSPKKYCYPEFLIESFGVINQDERVSFLIDTLSIEKNVKFEYGDLVVGFARDTGIFDFLENHLSLRQNKKESNKLEFLECLGYKKKVKRNKLYRLQENGCVGIELFVRGKELKDCDLDLSSLHYYDWASIIIEAFAFKTTNERIVINRSCGHTIKHAECLISPHGYQEIFAAEIKKIWKNHLDDEYDRYIF